MDNPFSGDNSNPFLTPYQAPGSQPAAPTIKPFTAVDLAPPAGQNGNRHSAPGNMGPGANMPAPSAGPFAGAEFSNAFLSRETPMQASPSAGAQSPVPANSLASAFAPALPANSAPVVNPFTGKPSPTPPAPADFTPVPDRPAPQPAPMPSLAPAAPAAPAMMPARPMAPPKPAFDPAEPHGAGIITVPSKSATSVLPAQAPAAPVAAPVHAAVKSAFPVSTGQNLEGHRIGGYLGVVSVEIVIPKDLLFRNPAPYGELHRIKAAEDQLQKVKAKAFEELTDRARALGADGIVGATLQFSQFDAVVFLCSAVGTAVRLG